MSKKLNILFKIPIVLLVVQAFDEFFSGVLSSIAGVFLLIFVIHWHISKRNKKFNTTIILILLFLLYTFLLALNSSNIYISGSGYLSTFVSFSLFIIAYNETRSYSDLRALDLLIIGIPIIFIFALIIFNYFGLGRAIYGGDNVIKMSDGMHHNTIYTANLAFVLFLAFQKKFKNITLVTVLNVLLVIIILLSFRRTSILLLIITIVIYLLYTKKRKILYFLYPTVIFIIIFSFYQDSFYNIIEARGERATIEGLSINSRSLEIMEVNYQISNSNDIEYILFGTEYLNSFGTYGGKYFYFPNSRILHTDYAVILHGGGVVGAVLYLIILLSFLIKYISSILHRSGKPEVNFVFLTLIIILVAVTFSGSILNITFRSTLFILLGAMTKLLELKQVSKI
jgi:hypothetical protein